MGLVTISASSSLVSNAEIGNLAADVELAALSFLEKTTACRFTAENIRAMCSSNEFIQNPKDALILWLIHGFKRSIVEGSPEEHAFICLMQGIPNFKETLNIAYLETFGERYFAKSQPRNQPLIVLRAWLNTPSLSNRLEGVTNYYEQAQLPGLYSMSAFTYLSAAKSDLKEVLTAFRKAEKLEMPKIGF